MPQHTSKGFNGCETSKFLELLGGKNFKGFKNFKDFEGGSCNRNSCSPPVFLDPSDPVAVAWPDLILLTSDHLASMASGNDHLKQRKPSKAARSIADDTAPTLNLESKPCE